MALLPLAVALVSEIIPAALKYFGKDKQAEVAEKVIDIAKQVSGEEEPDEATKAIIADPNLAMQFKQAILTQQAELARLSLQRETLYVGDVQDARKYRDSKLFVLGCVIYSIFFVSITLAMMGGYWVLTTKETIDAGILAAVSTFVGSVIGYTASQAQSVTNFNFGTSYGSMNKGDDMADAIKGFGKPK